MRQHRLIISDKSQQTTWSEDPGAEVQREAAEEEAAEEEAKEAAEERVGKNAGDVCFKLCCK